MKKYKWNKVKRADIEALNIGHKYADPDELDDMVLAVGPFVVNNSQWGDTGDQLFTYLRLEDPESPNARGMVTFLDDDREHRLSITSDMTHDGDQVEFQTGGEGSVTIRPITKDDWELLSGITSHRGTRDELARFMFRKFFPSDVRPRERQIKKTRPLNPNNGWIAFQQVQKDEGIVRIGYWDGADGFNAYGKPGTLAGDEASDINDQYRGIDGGEAWRRFARPHNGYGLYSEVVRATPENRERMESLFRKWHGKGPA